MPLYPIYKAVKNEIDIPIDTPKIQTQLHKLCAVSHPDIAVTEGLLVTDAVKAVLEDDFVVNETLEVREVLPANVPLVARLLVSFVEATLFSGLVDEPPSVVCGL